LAAKTTKRKAKQIGQLPKILILVGIMILVAVVFLLKNKPEDAPDLTAKAPETQLNWYLENKQPVFVFYHSTTCQTCVDMMAVVAQVYPEFKDQVGLVDVDVYQPWNQELLRYARVTNIPTQVFINEKGESQTMIGGLQPAELRAQLQVLAGGQINGD
jgi:thiol-disulfide isomerase/thioredoxin